MRTDFRHLELQQQYTNYKNGLQQIASKIGDVESEAEEHKFVPSFPFDLILTTALFQNPSLPRPGKRVETHFQGFVVLLSITYLASSYLTAAHWEG